MGKRKYVWILVIAILATMFIVMPLFRALGIPTYADLLTYMFGDPDGAGVWNGTILPIAFSVALMAAIIFIVVMVEKKFTSIRKEHHE
ncbi:hypothetical protein CR205_12890 [Alteribacter lacisalsi]|uniref:Uncharacterized protein n=1 Tax=Alteribacter lacisalsi TaxID=2045244 RepID=A0A2W0H950_9BACI|nr:hypothetical protein [Alteribacter lacisalsi]PYZ96600.1 hypothetical protein CR205_12890 [Alteribacter lacisalsi]